MPAMHLDGLGNTRDSQESLRPVIQHRQHRVGRQQRYARSV